MKKDPVSIVNQKTVKKIKRDADDIELYINYDEFITSTRNIVRSSNPVVHCGSIFESIENNLMNDKHCSKMPNSTLAYFDNEIKDCSQFVERHSTTEMLSLGHFKNWFANNKNRENNEDIVAHFETETHRYNVIDRKSNNVNDFNEESQKGNSMRDQCEEIFTNRSIKALYSFKSSTFKI